MLCLWPRAPHWPHCCVCTLDSNSLCIHHHCWPHGSCNHPRSHPHHNVIDGSHSAKLLRGLLVHPSPLHNFLCGPRVSRCRVRQLGIAIDIAWRNIEYFWEKRCLKCLASGADALCEASRPPTPCTTPRYAKINQRTGVRLKNVHFLSLLEGFLRYRLNYNYKDVYLRNVLISDNKCAECPPSQTWMWVIGPMVIYLCERLLRFIRYLQTVRYKKVGPQWRPRRGGRVFLWSIVP